MHIFSMLGSGLAALAMAVGGDGAKARIERERLVVAETDAARRREVRRWVKSARRRSGAVVRTQEGEAARRRRQIAAGSLKEANGLVRTPLAG